MGLLLRYQRAGGFVQLLQLIETCGKQKQDNFLNMIESEDPRWAKAVREKMLTVERIFSWDDNAVADIFSRLQVLTIATAMHGLSQEQSARFLKTFTHAQKRNLEDIFNAKTPSEAEITAAFLKILQETRTMISQGYLRVEKFAPQFAIPENYEEKLVSGGGTAVAIAENPGAKTEKQRPAATTKPAPSRALTAEQILALQNKLRELLDENSKLKSDLAELQEKLRKSAA